MWVEPVCGISNAGTAPIAASAKTAKTGEMVPRPEAATGANTKVISLSVAAIPTARGSREAGVNWFSTARRYATAAPLTNPETAASTMSQVNGTPYAAQKASEVRANVRMTTNNLKKVANGRFLPSRVIGMAPTTWASVIARIMAAPPLASPVRLKATNANAMGPAACGTPNVADEMDQRSSGHRLAGTPADGAPEPLEGVLLVIDLRR
jgi:hypothetical protein